MLRPLLEIVMVTLNSYKALSNGMHGPTFRHSGLVRGDLMLQLQIRCRMICVNQLRFWEVNVSESGMKIRYFTHNVCDVTLSLYLKLEKYAWPRWDSNLRPLEC